MPILEQWVQLAPKPTPLKEGQKWHVFLSYRSVHRPWVIQLYDILRHLGYEVFLDQYVLSAGDDLVLKLGEGLSKSGAGVLIWSKATADSEWCQKEYATMVAREMRDKDFHFVVAKLDGGDVPELAGLKIYQDFSEYREGPCGSGLLRLAYGLRNQPLSAEAVGFSESVDQDFRDSLLAIRAAREIGNGDELLRLAQSKMTPAWTSLPLLPCQVAEGLIGLKRYDDALAVLSPLEETFPQSIRPKQLKGLALRRKGNWKAAQEILAKLTAAGEMDPETMGIYAATWMDRYTAEGNELYLRKSRDLYAQAFLNAPNDSYVGINAAAKSVLLGDLEAARKYAEQVEQIVGDKPKPGNYWVTATVAENQLMKGDYSKAADLYIAAVLMEPESHGSHESTWKQAQLLMGKLGSTPEQRSRIGSAFQHLTPKEAAPAAKD
jgi:tetratricopeptide (TPR) repeat protein